MTLTEFFEHCTPCGGDWTRMIMTGIEKLAPDIWDAMPDRTYSFDEVSFIANHLCHDRPHLRYNRSIDGNIIEYTIEGKFVFREATEEEIKMGIREFEIEYNHVDPAFFNTNQF